MPAVRRSSSARAPGGSVMAMELAEAGWDVVIFEMGPNYYTNLEGQGPFPTVFSNDELKSQYRYFEQPDPLAYPRTFRQNRQPDRGEHLCRRRQRSAQPGRRRISALGREGHPAVGHRLQGTVAARPGARRGHGGLAVRVQRTRAVLRRDRGPDRGRRRRRVDTGIRAAAPAASKALPDAAGAQMRSSMLLAAGAKRLGLHPFPFPMAANSVAYNGSPACNNCGFCSGLRVPGLRQAGQPHRAAAGAADRANALAAADAPSPRSTSPAGGPPASPMSTRRASRWRQRRRRCAGLLRDLDAASGAAFRPARSLRPHRQTDHVSELLRRLRHLPQPARARLPRSIVHASRVRLQRSGLPRSSGSSPGCAGCRTSVPACASSAAARTRSRRASSTKRSSGFCQVCSFSAARSRS